MVDEVEHGHDESPGPHEHDSDIDTLVRVRSVVIFAAEIFAAEV